VDANIGENWELRLFGHPELRCDDGRLIDLPTKAFAIAARLLLDRPNQQCSRSELAEFLWSEVDSTHQRTNLRTLLKRIRSGIGGSTLSPFAIDGEIIALNLGAVRCDLLEFQRLLASGEASDLLEAAVLFSGRLLETRDRGSAAFEYWLIDQRLSLSQAFRAATRRALGSGDLDALPEKKETLARRLIEEDQNDEAGHRALIQIYASQGDIDQVRSTYDRLARSLKAERGCQPSEQTRALYRSLAAEADEAVDPLPLHARESNTDASSPLTPFISVEPRCPVLLVPLTLATDGGSPVDASADIPHDLLAQLWKSRSLRIVLSGRDETALAASGRFDDASVYRLHLSLHSAESVRLSARLVRAPASELVWMESFALTEERYDRVVARIADTVIGIIEGYQIEAEKLLSQKQHTSFALVAEAERALTNLHLPSVRRARKLLRAASQTVANAARVQAMLARTFWMEWKLRTGQDGALLMAARSLARSTLQMPLGGDYAHQELGMIALHQGQHQRALEHLSLARDQNPFDGRLLVDFAFALVGNGQAKEALLLVNAERPVDCRSVDFHNWVIASSHYALEEYEPAIAALSELATPGPNYRALAACYAMLGEREKANEYKDKYLLANPRFSLDEWLELCPMGARGVVENVREGYLLAGFR